MTQWTDSTAIWTTRSSDEWLGDGGASLASPIPVTATVQDHFAGTLSNVYQDTLLSVSTTFQSHTVEVVTTVEMESPLSVVVTQVAADLVIDTACHVSTQRIETTFPVHEGQRAEIAYQTVKPHAQLTPKNPIVATDVTLNPPALNIDAGMAGTVYAGYYTEITPNTITASSYMYPGGVIVSTNVETGVFSLTCGTEIDLAVIDISPTANIDTPLSVSTQIHPPQIEATCTAYVDTASVNFTFQGIELVSTGYATQDDLPIRTVMQDAQAWYDNYVQTDTLAANANIEQHAAMGSANSYADKFSLGLSVGPHVTSVSGSVDVSAPVGVMSSIPQSSVYFDYLLPATLQTTNLGAQSAEVNISSNFYTDTLSLHVTQMRPDYIDLKVTEFALLQSSLQRQVVLNTPVNAYSRASEVEA